MLTAHDKHARRAARRNALHAQRAAQRPAPRNGVLIAGTGVRFDASRIQPGSLRVGQSALLLPLLLSAAIRRGATRRTASSAAAAATHS